MLSTTNHAAELVWDEIIRQVDGNAWERTVAQALEALPGVAAYVKYDHLGFRIPYTPKGGRTNSCPTFSCASRIRATAPRGRSSSRCPAARKDQSMRAAKADTARDLWVPAVNNDGRWGRWGFCEVDDPTREKRDIGAAVDVLRRCVCQ